MSDTTQRLNIHAGHTRYTPVGGLRAWREAVAAKHRRENSIDTRGLPLGSSANPSGRRSTESRRLAPGEHVALDQANTAIRGFADSTSGCPVATP